MRKGCEGTTSCTSDVARAQSDTLQFRVSRAFPPNLEQIVLENLEVQTDRPIRSVR